MSRLQGTDPNGSGVNEQKVNKDGQALTLAISQTELEHESEHSGAAYNWTSDTISIDANDTVLLIKNTSDKHLHINSLEISNGSTASEYTVHLPTTEVTVTGVTVTGTNLNTANSNVANASAASDETNNTQGNVLETIYLAVDRSETINLDGLILGKNKSIAVDVVATVTETSATIIGHFED